MKQIQFSDEVKERLEILIKDIYNSGNWTDRCDIFMSATNQLKEAYVQLEAGHKYGDERTITHLLHKYNPRFLELDSRWVDSLIEAEGDMKDKSGWCNLMCLFIS